MPRSTNSDSTAVIGVQPNGDVPSAANVSAAATPSPDAPAQPVRRSTDCQFLTATSPVDLAFCEPFDAASLDPETRSGDLDATIWGVSRTNTRVNFGQQMHNDWLTAHLDGCTAEPEPVLPPSDVRVCDGRLYEASSDGTGESTLAMYPKQPFDIEGRTGIAVFDISANSEGPHAAWPEWWWTDQPVPAPHGSLPGKNPYARNSFGFEIASDNCADDETSISKMMITKDYRLTELDFERVGCVKRGDPDGALNHFEIRINKDRAEVWATDPGQTDIRLLASADVAMPLTRGVVWIEDLHYNGCKDNSQCDHTFVWDNVGFDGPTPYRDLTFDVQDSLAPTDDDDIVSLGYAIGPDADASLTAPGVYWLQDPTHAYVGFNLWPDGREMPEVRVNGGPWHQTEWPYGDTVSSMNTFALPIEMSEVVTGANTIEFRSGVDTVITNVNIILIAAAPVP